MARAAASFLALTLMMAGCDVSHLALGSVRKDGLDASSANDAEPPLDAADDAAEIEAAAEMAKSDAASLPVDVPEASMPMSAFLRALTREHVAMLGGPCASDCTEVEVVIDGGSGQAETRWNDGVHTRRRKVCVALERHLLQVEVSDPGAEPRRIALTLDLYAQVCASAGPREAWQVCHRPPLQAVTCESRQIVHAYALPQNDRSTVEPTLVKLELEGAAQDLQTIHVSTGTTDCTPEYLVPQGGENVDGGRLFFNASQPGRTPYTRVLVFATNSDVDVSSRVKPRYLELCERLNERP